MRFAEYEDRCFALTLHTPDGVRKRFPVGPRRRSCRSLPINSVSPVGNAVNRREAEIKNCSLSAYPGFSRQSTVFSRRQAKISASFSLNTSTPPGSCTRLPIYPCLATSPIPPLCYHQICPLRC